MSKWHSGPPPFPGWWNASNGRVENAWRWWDGKRWSRMAMPSWPLGAVVKSARDEDLSPEVIEWRDYWPKNARVPRIDPRKA